MDPNYGATGVRFATDGKTFAISLEDGVAKIVDMAELGLADRWITLSQAGNADGVAYFFRSRESSNEPNLDARDTIDDEGKLVGVKAASCEALGDGDPPEPGFVPAAFPILVLVSTGSTAVVRFKDAQIQ